MKIARNKKWYRPKEIAELGLIKNSTGGDNVSSNYDFILSMIRSGKLVAKDYCTTQRHYYLISEEEIERFNRG